MSKLFVIYVFLSILFLIFSYGFVDKNLILSTNYIYQLIHNPLQILIFEKRGWAGGIYIGFLAVYWCLYYILLKKIDRKEIKISEIKKIILGICCIFLFSFPSFSYDIFNYILTARVTFTYKENPWIIRPVDIPNEPALAYTRAANKTALYGPTWILLTYIPHVTGINNVMFTIISFKLLIILSYLLFLDILWRATDNIWNVAFFAFNPLVLFEILNDGHNDMVMMILVAASILLISKHKLQSLVLFILSVFIKGASVILIPLFIIKDISGEQVWKVAFWLLFIVFLVSPFREEMYPWYFVWCLGCVVFLPRSYRFMYGFSLVFCFGLLLRNTPYIITRQYDGYNQIARTVVTWIPITLYMIYYFFDNRRFKKLK